MSAQLVLRDIEMEALRKCISKAAADAPRERDFWKPGEEDAALAAFSKLSRALNRKSRRRPNS